MGDLLIRNVPEDLKRDLAEAAGRAGHSLSDEAKRRLRRSAPAASAETGTEFLQSMRAIFADVPDKEREDFAKIMDEIEEQRKKDFGRPFSFEE